MKYIYSVIAFIIISIFAISCEPQNKIAGKEANIIGIWKNPIFSFEFTKNGKLKIVEGKNQLHLDYFLTDENGTMYLHIISMGDTNKLYIDSLSNSYLRIAPTKNLMDIKEFIKIK